MSIIRFSVSGSGDPVILLHGFPLNCKMWQNFSGELAKTNKVYTPDLPGFGKSEPLPDGFSLKDVAQTLLSWMEEQKISKCVLIGHSLGGYIVLHMAELDPDKFAGIGLFHSTALDDSKEKKESRTKVVEFVHKNGAEAFTTNFIEPLFIDRNNASIPAVKKIAGEASAQAVIGYTLAMRDRKNQQEILKLFPRPILFLAGQQDNGIPVETIKLQSSYCQHPELHILAQSAHMGMYEQFEQSAEIVKHFTEVSHSRN